MKKITCALVVSFIFMFGKVAIADTLDVKDNVNYSKIEDGRYNNIAILIRFKGEDEFINEVNSQQINETYNYFVDADNDKFSDLGSISLKSYMNDLTYGKLKISTSFYPKHSDTSYYSIEAPNERSYYENFAAGSLEETELINWAFNEVKGNILLPSGELDKNNDGYIDLITFIVNGNEVSNNMLWSHETKYQGDNNLNDKKLGQYILVNSGSESSNIFNKELLKVHIHEFLHILDYPDLYRYYSNGKPVGLWDIMGDSYGNGQMPLVYTKDYYSNLNLNIKDIGQSGTYTLVNTQSKNKDDIVAYKIRTSKNSNEYFMIEFRKNNGNWDGSLPGSGLVVYRINESVNPILGNRNGSPDSVYVFRPNEYNSIAAGGYINGGFFSAEYGRTSLGSKEESKYFIDNSIFYSNGSNSGIVISEIGSSNGESISFKVTFPNEEIKEEIKEEVKEEVKEEIKKEIKEETIIGKDRYETSVLASKSTFENSDTVILVNGSAISDGLSMGPIASWLKAPVLLVRNNSITNDVINEISRLKATKVIIAGGTGVISKEVENKIKSLGINNIERLGGVDRYETSFEILKYIDNYLYDVENIIVGNGLAEADIMSIMPFASRDNIPVVLTRTDSINDNIYNWLSRESINNAYIIGGTGVVSDKVLNKVNLITSLYINNNRLGGRDRYETNAQIISKFINNKTDKLYLTKGLTLVDSLSFAPISSLNNGVIVLYGGNSLNSMQIETIEKINISKIIQVGGLVDNKILNQLR